MKNYLSLAAVLGMIAIAGVASFAQAEEAVAPVAAETTMERTVEADVKAECDAATAVKEDGTEPSAEEKAAAVEKCLEEKAAAEGAAATDADHSEE